MAGETASAALRDLLVTTKDGDWGRESAASGFVPYRVIRGTDFPSVRLGDTSSVPVRYLSESTVHRRTLKPNDILLETAGGSPDRPTGRTLLITERLLSSLDLPATCASFARFLRVDRSMADPRYVYWFLQYLYASGQMEEHQVQHTGVARFQYTKFAESQQIPLPAPDEQRAIAYILCTLDDKIELNRRMNETLEAMARALFQSWFVDFDPVRAKAEGRDAGLPKEIADLFPDRFEDSELGEIPARWGVRTLKNLTTKIGSGATPFGGSAVYVEEGVALIRSQNVHDHEFRWAGLARLTERSAAELRGVEVKPEDILLNITGDSVLRTCVVDPYVLPARVNQHVAIIRAAPGIPPRYLHLLLVQPRMKSLLGGLDAGGTRKAVTKGQLESVSVLDPPREVLARFAKTTTPLFQRVDGSRSESRSLAALRDTLLPKLISGELRVQDAQRFVGGTDRMDGVDGGRA